MLTRPETDLERIEREENTRNYRSNTTWETMPNDIKIIMAMRLLKKEFSFSKEVKRMPQLSIENDVEEEKNTTPLLPPVLLIWENQKITRPDLASRVLTQPEFMDIILPTISLPPSPPLTDPCSAAMAPCEEVYCGSSHEPGCIQECILGEDKDVECCTLWNCLKILVCGLPISIVACPLVSIASPYSFFSSKIDNHRSIRNHEETTNAMIASARETVNTMIDGVLPEPTKTPRK